MSARELIVLGSVVVICHSMTSLSARPHSLNPTCCVSGGDCEDNAECDYSDSCGDYPGTCVPIPPMQRTSPLDRR